MQTIQEIRILNESGEVARIALRWLLDDRDEEVEILMDMYVIYLGEIL
jgi:hypothetical protein